MRSFKISFAFIIVFVFIFQIASVKASEVIEESASSVKSEGYLSKGDGTTIILAKYFETPEEEYQEKLRDGKISDISKNNGLNLSESERETIKNAKSCENYSILLIVILALLLLA